MGVQNGAVTLNNSLEVSYQKKKNYIYHMTQRLQSQVFTLEKWKLMPTHTHTHTQTYTGMFTAALRIITRTRRELQRSSKGEWIECTPTRCKNTLHCGTWPRGCISEILWWGEAAALRGLQGGYDFWKKQNHRGWEQRDSCQRSGWRVSPERGNTRGFLAFWNTPIVVDSHTTLQPYTHIPKKKKIT